MLFVTGPVGVGKTAVLSGLIEHRADVQQVSAAIPGAAVTVVRLTAPLEVLEQRIRLREPATPDEELDGARWWTAHFEREHPEDFLVESDQRPLRKIAGEVLRLASWLSSST